MSEFLNPYASLTREQLRDHFDKMIRSLPLGRLLIGGVHDNVVRSEIPYDAQIAIIKSAPEAFYFIEAVRDSGLVNMTSKIVRWLLMAEFPSSFERPLASHGNFDHERYESNQDHLSAILIVARNHYDEWIQLPYTRAKILEFERIARRPDV